MFRPSGWACSTSTSRPRPRKIPGATNDAAPFAQSITIRIGATATTDDATASHHSATACVSELLSAERSNSTPAATTASSALSSSASSSSDNLRPPAAKNLMPLSDHGLCDAEITAPGTPRWAQTHATAGVGTTPMLNGCAPPSRNPVPSARSRRSPDSRVSRPITNAEVPRTCAAA